MTEPFTLTIPAPTEFITSNRRYHPQVKAKLTRAWKNAAIIYARQQLRELNPPVRIVAHIWKPRGGRYDPNNWSDTTKAIVDGIVAAGKLADDDHIHVIGPDHRHGGQGPAQIVLEITEINGEPVELEQPRRVRQHHSEA